MSFQISDSRYMLSNCIDKTPRRAQSSNKVYTVRGNRQEAAKTPAPQGLQQPHKMFMKAALSPTGLLGYICVAYIKFPKN